MVAEYDRQAATDNAKMITMMAVLHRVPTWFPLRYPVTSLLVQEHTDKSRYISNLPPDSYRRPHLHSSHCSHQDGRRRYRDLVIEQNECVNE